LPGGPKAKRNDNLSTDGKWRSFPKVPSLLQYVVESTYYACGQVHGKSDCVSIEPDVFNIAKLRRIGSPAFLEQPGTEVEAIDRIQDALRM